MEVKAVLQNNPKNPLTNDEFEAVFREYYPFVVRKVILIVKEQAIAEDIAQDSFVKLYHADSRIDNLPAWLTKVANNTAYNYIRSEKRHRARSEKEFVFAEKQIESAADTYEKQEDIHSIQHALSNLPDKERTLLLMRYAGFSYAEIAKSIGREASSIGTLLARAKQRFKKSYIAMKGAWSDELS
ncbi:sigma-70 family RNA polymerase sigma factor [Bacillus sp. HMF5848]|uniref:RNA polymerase sigma factor SigX n=1 Tax=Bacillus sp. HMF5848 TaxID=2495421 RepID=UPI000F79A051|nr:RNA polymerase sigma factor SigX [Bacillus sp. HMF5848]RSK27938.1 sigma-70 family RNA polymerase sigma factor [Bacillus sp. HMF5848]